MSEVRHARVLVRMLRDRLLERVALGLRKSDLGSELDKLDDRLNELNADIAELRGELDQALMRTAPDKL